MTLNVAEGRAEVLIKGVGVGVGVGVGKVVLALPPQPGSKDAAATEAAPLSILRRVSRLLIRVCMVLVLLLGFDSGGFRGPISKVGCLPSQALQSGVTVEMSSTVNVRESNSATIAMISVATVIC